MALTLQSNYANSVGQNVLNRTNASFTQSLERLSTGFRINSAADDSAGMQISNRLQAQSNGMGVAQRNVADATSMMSTAEGALDEVTNIAYRLNDLALQAANGTNSQSDIDAIEGEFNSLVDEMESIMGGTSFGGKDLLTDAAAKDSAGAPVSGGAFTGSVSFQVGAESGDVLSVNAATEIKAIYDSLIELGYQSDGSVATGGSVAITGSTAGIAAETAASGSSDSASSLVAAISGTGGLIDTLGAARAEFGANINRLEHTSTNLSNMQEQADAARGRIMDTDMAAESSNMSKQQLLLQAGTQVLSQTKMIPQLAMSLMG